MSLPVVIPNIFATQPGPIPLSQLDTNFSTIAAALNDNMTYAQYVPDSSIVANVITATIAAPQTFTLTTGARINVQVANLTTSGLVFLNVNGLGAVTVLNADGTSLQPGQLTLHSFHTFVYDGAFFRLQSPTTFANIFNFGNGSVTVPSIALQGSVGTGFYQVATNVMGFASTGTLWMELAPNLLQTIGDSFLLQLKNASLVTALQMGTVKAVTGAGADVIDAGFLTPASMQFFTNGSANPLFALTAGGFLSGRGLTAAALVDMSPDSGSFTATATGITGAPTGTVFWAKMGNVVVCTVPVITGVSSSTSFTLTGWPAVIQPTRSQIIACPAFGIEDNTASTNLARGNLIAGTLTMVISNSNTGWTAAGTKGISTTWTFTYMLN